MLSAYFHECVCIVSEAIDAKLHRHRTKAVQLTTDLMAFEAVPRSALKNQARYISLSRMCSKHCQDAYRSCDCDDWCAKTESGWGAATPAVCLENGVMILLENPTRLANWTYS
jgi:hypothetical protein